MATDTDTRSLFMELPTELRMLIYSFAVLNANTISVGTAKLIGSAPDIIYRQYGGKRTPFRGIPQQSEPVVASDYDPALLVGEAIIELPSLTESCITSTLTSYQSLLRLNRQIRGELRSHSDLPAHRQTKLFVNYPHGLHVLQTTAPELLQQSRSVHVCGSYVSQTYMAPQSSRIQRSSRLEASEKLQGEVVPDASSQLSKLVKDFFGSDTPSPIEKLELRIYYPGHYSTIWNDDDSPTAIVLRNVACGRVDMIIWRGIQGSGVHLTATPVKQRMRMISTSWRTLNDGGPGQPHAGSFVLDAQWPS